MLLKIVSTLLVRISSCPRFISIMYVTSCPLFLKFTPSANSVYFRSPTFYRPVEWMIVKTPLQLLILNWSELIGVRERIEIQSFYYGIRIVNPSEEIHFNFSPDGNGQLP